MKINTRELEGAALDFVNAYVEALLWSSSDGDEETLHHETPSDSLTRAAVDDCARFREAAGHLLDEWTPEQAGHDFALTRNGHGTGFWDRDKEHSDELTKICEQFGQADVYLGDDGLVYQLGRENG